MKQRVAIVCRLNNHFSLNNYDIVIAVDLGVSDLLKKKSNLM